MAGQVSRSGQGSLGQGVSIALAGIAIVAALGAISGSEHGQESVLGQGAIIAVKSFALNSIQTGIAVGQGTITRSGDMQLTLNGGNGMFASTGTLSAGGQPVTVNVSGVEADAAAGDVSAGRGLAGGASTAAAGSATSSRTLVLAGESITSDLGLIAPDIGAADDTFITSALGAFARDTEVAIAGSEFASAAGTLGAQPQLFGAEATAGQGDTLVDVLMPLAGAEIASGQYVFGAPGTAALTGAESTVTAGDVFLNDDRTYPITGQAITVGQGDAVTSYLAFATGAVLTVSQERIGPQTVGLAGAEIATQPGTLVAPELHNVGGTPTRRNMRGPGTPKKWELPYTYEVAEAVAVAVESEPLSITTYELQWAEQVTATIADLEASIGNLAGEAAKQARALLGRLRALKAKYTPPPTAAEIEAARLETAENLRIAEELVLALRAERIAAIKKAMSEL